MKKLLFLLFIASSAFANDLTLYVVPTPKGLDWNSPRSLFMSAIENKLSFASHFMGHAWVEIKCDGRHELTGMVNEQPDYLSKIILEEKGLGIFYHSFPGRLEKKDDVVNELAYYKQNGRMNFVTFKISSGQCKRALKYLDQFREKNVDRNFGLAHRPRHGEGADSSSFAVSFPDVLKVLDQEMKEAWIQSLNIPLELKDQEVSFFKAFTRTEWATENEKKVKLSFWNLDKMYNWINEKVAQKKSGYTISTQEKVSGIVIDKSHFPVPAESIWLQQLDPANKKQTLLIEEPSRPPKK